MGTQAQAAPRAINTSRSERANAVDIVKGIAIILVVLGHTAQGMMHRGWWLTPRSLFLETFIYSFHMPAFFFVSGLFVKGSIAKRGAHKFTVEKMKTVLYPYVILAIMSAAIEPLVEQFRSSTHPFQWRGFLFDLADGQASWFLFTLFVCLILALLTVNMSHWSRFLVAAAIGMTPAFGPPLTNQVLREFCFVAAGMWVGRRIYDLNKLNVSVASAALLALVGFQLIMILVLGRPTQWTYILLGMTGTAGMFMLARILDGRSVGTWLIWIGQASLAIFLLSEFGQGAGREVLSRAFHTKDLWLQLIFPSLLAILPPAVMWHRQDQWHLRWLFQWPF
jgi:fucose 4-O-acetylase-like acetyltransferase